MKWTIIVALVCAWLVVTAQVWHEPEPQPAGSDYWDSMPYFPRLYYPPPGGDVLTVQVNAGPGTWQIRRIAKALDAQVEGVVVRTSGDCAEVDVCVGVNVALFDEMQMLNLSNGLHPYWDGLMTYTSDMRGRTIYLNLATPGWRRSLVVAHELGHVFGLDHHKSRGVMSLAGRTMSEFHPREIALLNQHYGVTP